MLVSYYNLNNEDFAILSTGKTLKLTSNFKEKGLQQILYIGHIIEE